MNQSAAKSVPTVNGYEGHYRPVWASSFRVVKSKGRTVYFDTAASAECAAWRYLYALEQRVMRRDGEMIFAARSEAEQLFKKKERA